MVENRIRKSSATFLRFTIRPLQHNVAFLFHPPAQWPGKFVFSRFRNLSEFRTSKPQREGISHRNPGEILSFHSNPRQYIPIRKALTGNSKFAVKSSHFISLTSPTLLFTALSCQRCILTVIIGRRYGSPRAIGTQFARAPSVRIRIASRFAVSTGAAYCSHCSLSERHYTSLNSTQARLDLPRTLHTLQRGRAAPLARLTRHQSIHRSSRSQTHQRAQWHQKNLDHSLPPGLTGLRRCLSSRRKFLVQCMVPKAHERTYLQVCQGHWTPRSEAGGISWGSVPRSAPKYSPGSP